MSNVLTFTPRPRPIKPAPVSPIAGPDLRTRLEEAAQTALDVADRIIAALDHIDGDTDLELDAEAEPSLAAPEGHVSQIIWARGGDQDREAEAPEAALPTVEIILPAAIAPDAEAIAALGPLRWGGGGNVVSAAGIALLALMGQG